MKNITLLISAIFFSFIGNAQNYWNEVPCGTNKKLMSVSFGSSTVGYISGADSLLLKTTDGGTSWLPVNYSGLTFLGSSKDIIHVNFINATTGYAIVSNYTNPVYSGDLFKTVDGGNTWTTANVGNVPFSTFFFDENNGFECGSAFFAGHVIEKRVNNAPVNYHNFNLSPDEFLYGVDFRNSNVGITCGSGGYIYRTFNGGVTWDTIKTFTDSTIYAVKFLSDSTIVGACKNEMAGIIISHDTGKTWMPDNSTLSFFYPFMRSIVSSTKDSFIAVGMSPQSGDGVIVFIKNKAANWVEAVSQPLNSVTMSTNAIAYAVGDSGLIVTNKAAVLSVNEYASGNNLLSIYPNPSKGKFSTSMKEAHTTTVYNIAGKKILEYSLMQKAHEINISNSASGVYFIEAKTETGKLYYQKVVVE